MSTKVRLISAISMFCLVLSLMMVGVWAVQSATVNVGGTVTFNAKDIYATITGTVTGSEENPKLQTLNYSAKGEPSDTELASWSNNLNFTDDGLITFTINVQNLSGERKLYVIVKDSSTAHSNITKTLKVKNGSATQTTYTSGTEVEIATKTTAVYTFSFKVNDTNAGANLTYKFEFDLRDEKHEEEASAVDLKYDADAGYYYVEMGTYNNSAVRWRLVGIKENGASETTKFTSSTAPSAGSVGTFILETLIDYKALNKTFDSSDNDYATSDIRTYLNGDYKTFLNLTDDATYNAITAREISDLYTDMAWRTDDNYQVEDISLPSGATGADKLWLMSVAEVYTLLGGGTIGADGTIASSWSTEVKAGCNWDADNTSDY
ncbi:MAG: hypothetical protein J6C53_00645, partial [Clostridia bacterium]|nr:hypothetical protein [Clostridia bacterium]